MALYKMLLLLLFLVPTSTKPQAEVLELNKLHVLLLHSVGPVVAKQRSPNWLRDLLTKHVRLSADSRGRRSSAVTSVHSSAGYTETVPANEQ